MVDFDPDMMPHRPPMRMVDGLLEAGEKRGVASFQIQPGNLFVDKKGIFAREALVEVMAQTFMALSVWQAAQKGETVSGGYLVGLRNLSVHADAHPGDMLVTEVEAADSIGQVAVVAGRVFCKDMLVAQGELRLYTLPTPNAA